MGEQGRALPQGTIAGLTAVRDAVADPVAPKDEGVPVPAGDYEDLICLARQKSSESRRQLMEMVTDIINERGEILNIQERALMTDIIQRLVHEVELPVTQALADRLASISYAPRELILHLANDRIEIAKTILLRSTVLLDMDLVEIVRHRTMQHQLAIAMRDTISEAVTDALVETGEVDVIRTLLENENAQISRATMDYLVERAKQVDAFQNPILHRQDLAPDLAKKLYWWVSVALRRHILEHFQIDPMDLDDQLEATVQDLVGEAQEDSSPGSKAEALARQLRENNALTPTLMVQVLRQGEVPLFEAMFSCLTELRMSLVRRLLYEPGGEGLAIACRALDIEKPTFASLFLLSRRARPDKTVVDPLELSRVLAFFDKLDKSAAEKMVKRWRRDPQFLEAMWRVESAGRDKTN